MKKIFLILIFLLFTSFVFADDLEDLRQEKEVLQQRLTQYQQTVQTIRVRIIEINGVIKYLQQKATEEKTAEQETEETDG